jgi:hypothetical protein
MRGCYSIKQRLTVGVDLPFGLALAVCRLQGAPAPGCNLTRPAESVIAIVNFYRSNGPVRVGAPAFPR